MVAKKIEAQYILTEEDKEIVVKALRVAIRTDLIDQKDIIKMERLIEFLEYNIEY